MFPTDRWQRRQAERVSRPLALTQHGQGGVRLTAVDAAASSLGLSAGMSLADARALAPELAAVPAEPEADATTLAGLAEWCKRYSPWSATDGVDGLCLDITGCAHLFGGEAALLADALRRLACLGFTAWGAVADAPAAAWGWARYRPAGVPAVLPQGEAAPLLGLPVAALRLEAGMVETLIGFGLANIGLVAALPRAPLALRLGEALIERLDRMFGRLAEPISPTAPARIWRVHRVFAEPIGRREDIDAATRDLVGRLCRELSTEGQGARRLALGFFRVDSTIQWILIGTSRPSHAPAHLLRLFAERLEEVEPGFGIEAMVLESPLTEALAAHQSDLAAADVIDAGDLAALIDRLQMRLGHARVAQLVPVESHVPERAEVRKPPSVIQRLPSLKEEGRVGGAIAALPVSPSRRRQHPLPVSASRCRPPSQGVRCAWTAPPTPARPLRLLSIPEPIAVMAPIPDDPPLSFRWRRAVHRVAAADGPERIGPEWWLADAPRKPRDYYRVEDEAGCRFWLYREGLYGAGEPPRWFLHGFFA
jgi:protein ImuB